MILDSINNRLQTTLIQHGKIHLQFQVINIQTIATRVVNSYQLLALDKGLYITLDVKKNGYIWGDELRFSKILDQLLSNAVKFSPAGTHITVSLYSDTSRVFVSVQDNGQGLTSYDQEHLFKRFIPLSAQPTGGETSLGLGLNLAKQLVELHSGNISAQSAGKGMGATFTVSFPHAESTSAARTA